MSARPRHPGTRILLAAAVALAALGAPRHAHADEPEPGIATTRALFHRARALMDEGRFAEACPLLARAVGESPDANGARFNLAFCFEHLGKVASAWALYLDVANIEKLAGHADRERAARESATALEKRLPWLTVIVTQPQQGLVITRSGVRVDRGLFGNPLPVDPGDYAIVAAAPGHVDWSARLHLAEGAKETVVIPALAASPPVAPPRVDRPLPSGLGAQRVAALATGVAAVVGIGVGAAFGVRAIARAGDANAPGRCDSSGCDQLGFDARRESRSAADAATVSFVVGGALAALAGVLWLTAPRALPGVAVGADVRASGATLVLGASFR